MAKRSASTELNKDNCDVDDPPEEPGVFQQASEDTLKKRVMKKARRRCADGTAPTDAVKVLFSGFSGFSQAGQSNVASKPSFSFLSSSSTTSSATTSGSNGTDDKPKETSVATPVNGNIAESSSKQSKDKEYYSKLKGLNESVSQWISTHVSKNPLCILSPVFRDYEKHLQSIESARKTETSSEETGKDKTDDAVTESKVDSLKSKDETSSSEAKEEVKSQSSSSATTSLFGTSFGSASTSIFSQSFKSPDKVGGTIFGAASSPPSATFRFGMSSNTSLPSAAYTFGGSSIKPFTFANVSKPEPTETTGDNDDDAESEEPPKPDHKTVTEEGAVYEKRCKVFIKKDGQYADRGVGNLFLKPVCDGQKTQLIVRADTSLGNIILNVLLSSALPTTRVPPNNVALVCVPSPDEKPPPTTVLLRVKTSDDADELLAALEKHKK